jgi:anti-anti-sigma factor
VIILVVLLVSMIGNTRLTVGAVIICTLLAIAIVGSPGLPDLRLQFGWALSLIQMLAAGVVVLFVWVISDRLTASLISTMNAATQRAAEAEAARVEAEAARVEIEQRNVEQQRLLELVQTLELPVLPIGQGVLVTPLVGNLDSSRVEAIQRRLLDMLTQQRAHTVVLDVTGISVLDTTVAQHLLLTAQAVRLLGARTLLSGISANVAQTLVGLGVALDGVQPVSNLGQALEVARQH